ncbi:DUF4350 domain-containing protein [Pseudozobellia thermophila]|uniref:DUF4350 domain-containing protein n=1 Tax=Pseudozobellia thermophila TaxID=192903 RepID=A0A1M6MKC7_9FLAO|nr:DUF4350 domain-containing protein [Pseudozobellia thermophila]SHJ83928.1 protein of unknown function [Pseudozobellia thermophila]
MLKKGVSYIVIIVLTVGLLMLLAYSKPKDINWFPSYVAQHKIPYGTFVLNDVIDRFFPDNRQQVYKPPFEFLNETPYAQGTYFFVNDNIEFGEAELDRLLEWVAEGNTLFVAADDFEDRLLDSLRLKTAGLYGELENVGLYRHRLVNPRLGPEKDYVFGKDRYTTYFKEVDPEKTTVLGTVDNGTEKEAPTDAFYNVIKHSFGKGEIILSTFPKAFTNYFILKEGNKDYTAGLLSYLDGSRTLFMDNHYKSGKSVYTSPMYIFLNTKEFKWAYYLVLIGVVLYLVFEGKRKQRPIPVIHPLKNQTLAFTRTIADMYYEQGEGKAIAVYKINYFKEYLRTRFYLDTIKNDPEFYKNLAARSSHTPEEVERLFLLIEHIGNQQHISNAELQKLNSAIDKFKRKAHGN